jgi:hypothetical protein
MIKIFWIVVGIVLVGVAAFGGFEEGKAYQSNQAATIRNQFFQGRGLSANISGTPSSGNRGAAFGGGVTGRVKDIQGNTLDLSTATDVTTVDLSANTQIEKAVPGTSADLQPGELLVIRGSRNSDGSLAADQIQIVNSGAVQGPTQSTPTP